MKTQLFCCSCLQSVQHVDNMWTLAVPTFTDNNVNMVIKWLQTMLTVWKAKQHFNKVKKTYVYAYLDTFLGISLIPEENMSLC